MTDRANCLATHGTNNTNMLFLENSIPTASIFSPGMVTAEIPRRGSAIGPARSESPGRLKEKSGRRRYNGRCAIQQTTIGTASFPPLSKGTLRFVRLDQQGAWIEFELPHSVKPGRHQLTDT